MGKGSRRASFIWRLSLIQSVLYRRFHCTSTRPIQLLVHYSWTSHHAPIVGPLSTEPLKYPCHKVSTVLASLVALPRLGRHGHQLYYVIPQWRVTLQYILTHILTSLLFLSLWGLLLESWTPAEENKFKGQMFTESHLYYSVKYAAIVVSALSLYQRW